MILLCGNITPSPFVLLLGLINYAIVKTLSNFHLSQVINEGIKRRGLDTDGKRMKDLAPVDCPEQMMAYCKTFHLIDKGNGVELRYTMANGGSKLHGWTPKLSF